MPKLVLMVAVKCVTWVLWFPCFKCVSLAASCTILAAAPCGAANPVYLEPKPLEEGALGQRSLPSLGRPGPCSRVPPRVLLAGPQVRPLVALQALSFLLTVDALPRQICCAYAVSLACVLRRGRMCWLLIPTPGGRDTRWGEETPGR